MIKIPLTKILFLDIETVGIEKDYDTCLEKRPELANQFMKYYDWFQKRFPEDHINPPNNIDERTKRINEVFSRRTALVPEFAKIVCISVSFVTDKGEIKSQSFSGDDEKELLQDCQKLLNRCAGLDFYLCGHNLKNFDIPMMAKRMIINGLLPPSLLPSKSSDKRLIYKVGQSRLDKISQQYYGTPLFGWLIQQANPQYSGFEFVIPDGAVLTIPFPLITSLQDYKNSLDNYLFYYGR